MRTTYRIRQPLSEIFLRCAYETPCVTPAYPTRFMEIMSTHRGVIGSKDENGLELRNPLIVAMGDSVTAGFFESLFPPTEEKRKEMFRRIQAGEHPATEITDARESYVEKFREKLIDRYERTNVSVINAGIAGDNLVQMRKRTDRDIIQHQPDLVLINGSLNWGPDLGTTEFYRDLLDDMVSHIKDNCDADIILLTPNGQLPFPSRDGSPVRMPETAERAEAIREVAAKQKVCLSDTYAVWERALAEGCPWEELLANRFNHPSVEGHEVYAIMLMKLFDVPEK